MDYRFYLYPLWWQPRYVIDVKYNDKTDRKKFVDENNEFAEAENWQVSSNRRFKLLEL